MKYRIIKQEPNGKTYDVECNSEEKLVMHLKGTFECTDHTVILVVNLSKRSCSPDVKNWHHGHALNHHDVIQSFVDSQMEKRK